MAKATNVGIEEVLVRTFGELIKPERVKAVRVTRATGDTASGFLLTNCPTENQDHWKDFEAHLEGKTGSIKYAVVDGKRLTTGMKDSRKRAAGRS